MTRPGADATEIVSTATDLEPFETMTIATDFEPDTFAVAWTPPERTPWGGLWLLLPRSAP
ncbi:hypothetical protein G7085_15385 [Tessaracoccus sp. HDW20]|uniref:hypothetical protein n=1 Tax=Tessaracoccus coleopterorum TaxID=2714950 RepID=UPI0018D2872C|nr:hypothetical protein [Tessaracoccus coleopterorum]NHB85524.1 hypothetical protein [Tessaracoccus coleopterorum]